MKLAAKLTLLISVLLAHLAIPTPSSSLDVGHAFWNHFNAV
jgi:hypothetical protein